MMGVPPEKTTDILRNSGGMGSEMIEEAYSVFGHYHVMLFYESSEALRAAPQQKDHN